MMRSVFLKTLYERRWFVIGWTIGLAAIAALLTSFYPAMHQDGSLDALLKNMPKAFEGLVGNLADLQSFDTYIASQMFDIRLPLIAGIMAIILGLGLSTSEEETGELRTVVALPISRTKLLFEKWFALVVISFIAVLGVAAGVYMVLPFVGDNPSIEGEAMLRLLGLSWLLMVTLGTVPFATGMATGKKAVATLVGILVIIGSFLITTFGQAVDWLESAEKFSLLHYFPAVDVVKGVNNYTDILVLGTVTVVVLIIAYSCFRTRDIG